MIKTLQSLPLLVLLTGLPSSATVEPLVANGVCEEVFLELLDYPGIDDDEAHEIYLNCLELISK